MTLKNKSKTALGYSSKAVKVTIDEITLVKKRPLTILDTSPKSNSSKKH